MSNELILAKITTKVWNKAPHKNHYQYTLSDGSKLVTKKNLEFKTWYFFEVSVDNLWRQHQYVSHAAVRNADAVEYQALLSDLKMTSYEVTKAWKTLNSSERQMVIRRCGVAFGAASSATFAVNGVTQLLVEETILGTLTGGLSLLVSAGFAGFSYLQYEELKEATKKHTQLMQRFLNLKTRYTRQLMRFTPPQYDHLRIADPEFTSIVSRLKSVISNINLNNFNTILPGEMKFVGVAA